MKTITMTTEPPATAPEENKGNKLFTKTQSTADLSKIKNEIKGLIGTTGVSMFLTALGSFVAATAGSAPDPSPIKLLLITGSVLALGGVGVALFSVFHILKLKKYKKKAIPQAITEVSSWLKESYGIEVSEDLALHLAKEISSANTDSRAWRRPFEDETGKWEVLRCNPEGLFYLENADGQKTLTQISETVAESIKSLTLHASNPALTDTDTQLLESMQTKANSLLTSDTTAEAKAVVEQVTAEALEALKLNETLTKLSPENADSDLSSILQLLDTELDEVLGKEVTQVKQKMERQKLYVHSRQKSEIGSKLKLNS